MSDYSVEAQRVLCAFWDSPVEWYDPTDMITRNSAEEFEEQS